MTKNNPILEVFWEKQNNSDYSEQRLWHRKKEFEYEKRSISSLIYGSGGAITILFGFASSSIEPDKTLTTLLFSLVCLLVCLVFSGLAQFLLNELSSLRFIEFTFANNAQNHENALNNLEAQKKIFGIIKAFNIGADFNDENYSKNKFELKDKAIKLKQQRIEYKKKADKFVNWIAWFMRIAAITFFLAVAFPILKILCGGTFYG